VLLLLDENWRKAKYRVDHLGHREEDDPDRYERLVRAAYEDERRRGHMLFKSGIGRFLLLKSIGKGSTPTPHQVKRKPTKGKPAVGGWAQGQRPEHKRPDQR